MTFSLSEIISSGSDDDDFIVSIIPSKNEKNDEVIVSTHQGRTFRVVFNKKVREVRHMELTKKKTGWKDAFSHVLFKTGPSYYASTKCLIKRSSSNDGSEDGVLILSEKSLTLWSGKDVLEFNSELLDLNELFTTRLHQIQGRLDAKGCMFLDITSNNKLGASWILACSQGPLVHFDDDNQSQSQSFHGQVQSMDYSNYLTLHRVTVHDGGGKLGLDSSSNYDGDEDLLLIDLDQHQPTEFDRWELLETDSLIPNFLVCRHAQTNLITAVFAARPIPTHASASSSSRSRWDQQFGEGFRIIQFVRQFPNYNPDCLMAKTFGLNQGHLLSVGVLEHTSDLFLVSMIGETYILPSEPTPSSTSTSISSSTSSSSISTLTSSFLSHQMDDGSSAQSLSALAAKSNFASSSSSSWSDPAVLASPNTLAESLKQSFECHCEQGTANQIAHYLKPIRYVLEMGDKTAMLSLVQCVVALSVQVVDAPLDGSTLVHHALSRKVSEHKRLLLFFEQFILSTPQQAASSKQRNQHPEWKLACAKAKIQVLKHRQQLAAACALREFTCNLMSSEEGRDGSSGVLQRALLSVAESFKGRDNLRRLRLASGLAEHELFFEAPTKSMGVGFEALMKEARDSESTVPEVRLTIFRTVFEAFHVSLLAAQSSVNQDDTMSHKMSNDNVVGDCWSHDVSGCILDLYKAFQDCPLNIINNHHSIHK
eukprot:CAMPEP_0114328228 /NCGR_PEP_ID=MMETSP0101-20121206/268_1 /TAXON_ID=38822 ORGANISM="Pteridomonas danica, Strain PT" /NCGR_SAMPLE_ID=MMETSP0101 /ASSEMBLY_ACC=CAM_ASM_000211 /LENGTH=707 /DNA_ID=CAMNT_0001457483 /DNA_START=480 /DNA_END=2603 /DNA_ORIENTATION=-